MTWYNTALSYIGLQRLVSNVEPRTPSESFEKPTAPTQHAITAIAPGLPNDGINSALGTSGTLSDRSFGDLRAGMIESQEAWRTNPLARRITTLVTAYVVGDGIQISSTYEPLQKFIDLFTTHARNNFILRQPDLCSELTRSGEIFIALFPEPNGGIPHLRAIPASQIDQIEWKDGDYETETRYHQIATTLIDNGQGTWWSSPDDPNRPDDMAIVLHYAINRPIGNLRGEGDLIPVLTWLRRYTRWLEDRIRLNAGTRAFLWIVKVAKAIKSTVEEKYRTPPEPGSIIVAEQGAEDWSVVAPSLHANDAANDGRAIRWMVAAGGPGIGLVDLGEGQDANLATATAMQEQRRRFLRQRQAYFAWILADVTLHAWHLYASDRRARKVTFNDLVIETPDISPEDSAKLAAAVKDLTQSFQQLQEIVGISTTLKRWATRLFAKFIGDQLSQQEVNDLINTANQPTQPTSQETITPSHRDA